MFPFFYGSKSLPPKGLRTEGKLWQVLGQPGQAYFDYYLFEAKLHNWINDIPPANLDATGPLPEPLQVVRRRGHSSITETRIQFVDFWATSGSVRWSCPTLRLGIKAPGGLYPSSKTPTVQLYVPVISWNTLLVDDVREALVVAARDLLKEQDPRETLLGQPLVRGLVGATPLALLWRDLLTVLQVEQQIATLRAMIGAMPPSVWKLCVHQHKISGIQRSLIWNSQTHVVYHNIVGSQYEPFVEYNGPQGRLYQILDRDTRNTVLTFVVDGISEFEWQLIVPPSMVESTKYASTAQVMGMVLNSLYISS